NQTASEGTSTPFNLGSFSDFGVQDNPWHVSIDWGDATSASFDTDSQGSLSAMSHVYADNGTFQVNVAVTDKDGATGSADFMVAVSDAGPVVIAPTNQSAVEGTDTSFNLGSFSDLGLSDFPWSVTVNWGDATSTIFSQSSQGSLGILSHAYGDNGAYAVSV